MATDRLVSIEGLTELNRAFKVAGSEMSKDFREALRSAAEPVRSEAEARASSEIRNLGLAWSRMRTGITRSSVYIAPRSRGQGSKRPNLAGLLLERAMEPALDNNIEKVVQEVDDAITDMSRAWERVG